MMMTVEKHYLGIDVGGTKIKTVVLNEKGEIIDQKEMFTQDDQSDQENWKKNIHQIIADSILSYGKDDNRDLNIGISAPGLVDEDHRLILNMPERLKGIENYNWSEELGREIHVINDGHAACLAEYESFYKSKGIINMLMLTLGTGVGGGAVLNGELFHGNIQRAGHVGHITIDSNGAPTMTNMVGSLEFAVGNFSVAERTHGRYKSVQELVNGYKKKDTLATYWWLSSIQKLAAGLASLINILSPELIVLGGGITSGAKDDLLHPLKKFMSIYEWRPTGTSTKIVAAKHGSYSGAIGAAFFAKFKTTQNNT